MNLLILRKETEVVDSILSILNDELGKCTVISDSRELETILITENFDLVIIDFDSIENPEEFYTQIKRFNLSLNVSIIFLLNNIKQFNKLYSLDCIHVDFLLKPFNPTLFRIKINTIKDKMNNLVKEYEEKIEKLKNSIQFSLPHEMRTSLGLILGHANFIKKITEEKKDIPPQSLNEINEMSDNIISAGNHLQRISENLILFSNIELLLNTKNPNHELFVNAENNTTEVINDIVYSLAIENQRYNDFEINLEPVKLIMNSYLFYKIIYELIDNAIKFSETGTKITIATFLYDSKFFFIITDDGRGMMKKEINNIGPFRQFDRDKYEQQGVGLGLFLTMKIAEIYGGNVKIQSKKQEGTQIIVTLPHNQ